MAKKIIRSDKAPKAAVYFSQAVLHDSKHTLELSGQVGINPETGKLVEGGIGPQTEQTLTNIQNILASIGWKFENIVKTRIYLADMADYQAMNEIYAKKFPQNPPARLCVAVKQLPLGALVEIECTAAGDNTD